MTNAFPVSFGERLRRERERRHWTQEHLAGLIGTTALSVNRWENGKTKPHRDMLQALTDLFKKPVEAWGASRARVWTVPYLRNRYFTGRDRILARLHTVLNGEQVVAVSQARAISGLGGIGKTQTALEYAYRYADEYDLVLWVRADSREALIAQFAGLAAHFGLPNHAEADQHRLAQAVKRWLETQEEQVWLLIFDNVDDIPLVQEFLPTRGNGAVLLTTRLHAVGKHMRKIELDKLALEEGVRFLLGRLATSRAQEIEALPAGERQAAEQLCVLLDGLPLALDQAAAYIEEHACSLAEYLALYQAQRALLLRQANRVDRQEYPDSVATTWLLSFQRVEQASPAAADLLRLLAFLHPDAIPEAVLRSGVVELGPHLQPVMEHPLLLLEAIANAQRYSLIRRNPETRTLTMHRLVQAVIQDGLDASRARQWAERAVLLVNQAFPEPEFATWERCEQLMPHVLVCADHIETWHIVLPEAAHLLHRAGHYLKDRARYAEALLLYQRALAIREQVLGLDHPDVANSLNALAILYEEQGQYAQSLPLKQRALAIREQALGLNHPDVAESLNNLAIFYDEQGHYAEALPLYQRALAIDEQAWGPTHPYVAIDLNNLALLYKTQGYYAEALPLYQRALAIWEQAYGPNHPDVATGLNNLARFYYAQGHYAEALPLFERALAIREQTLEPNHPHVGESLNNLGRLYHAQGHYATALPLYQRALAIREQMLGPNHPLVAQCLNNLAELSHAQGQDAETLPLYQRALAIREQTLGPTHPDKAETLYDLALLYRSRGQDAEALPCLQRALAIWEQALPDHPNTAACREKLADLLSAMGQAGQPRALQEST